MGDFGKKNSCRLISSEKKILQTNKWGKKFTPPKKTSFMAYNPDKKSYTVVCRGKKFYHQRSGGTKILR